MKSKFKLFLKWGITFKNIFTIDEKEDRKIYYSSKDELMNDIRNVLCKVPMSKSNINSRKFKTREVGEEDISFD